MTEREIHLWAWNNLGEQGEAHRDDGRGGDGPPSMYLTGDAAHRVFDLLRMLCEFELDDLTEDALLALFRAAQPSRYLGSMRGAGVALRKCVEVDWHNDPQFRLYVRFPH